MNPKDARSIQTSLSLSLRIPGFNPRGDAGNYPWYVLRERSTDPRASCRVLRGDFRGIDAELQGHGKLIGDKRTRSPNVAAVTVRAKLSTQRQKMTFDSRCVANPRAYDRFYQSLISEVKVFNVTALLSMEELKYTTALPL